MTLNDADSLKSNSSLYPAITEDQFQAYSTKKLKGYWQNKTCPPANVSYVAIMLPTRKTINKKTLHEAEEHSSKTFGLRLLLIVYLMN